MLENSSKNSLPDSSTIPITEWIGKCDRTVFQAFYNNFSNTFSNFKSLEASLQAQNGGV